MARQDFAIMQRTNVYILITCHGRLTSAQGRLHRCVGPNESGGREPVDLPAVHESLLHTVLLEDKQMLVMWLRGCQ